MYTEYQCLITLANLLKILFLLYNKTLFIIQLKKFLFYTKQLIICLHYFHFFFYIVYSVLIIIYAYFSSHTHKYVKKIKECIITLHNHKIIYKWIFFFRI